MDFSSQIITKKRERLQTEQGKVNYIFKYLKPVVVSILIVGSLLIACLCLFFSRHEMRIICLDVANYAMHPPEAKAFVDVAEYEKDNYGNSNIDISGWCVIQGKPTAPVALHVVLRDMETDKYYWLPTTVVTRKDVTEAYNDGVNYDNSGYSISIDDAALNAESYEIYVCYESEGERYLIPSNVTVMTEDKEKGKD